MIPGRFAFPHNERQLFKKRQGKKRVIMVFYIGGITFSEISAIRFLNKITKDKVFVIATTEIINGIKCIK